jgi:hypothetical protein
MSNATHIQGNIEIHSLTTLAIETLGTTHVETRSELREHRGW